MVLWFVRHPSRYRLYLRKLVPIFLDIPLKLVLAVFCAADVLLRVIAIFGGRSAAITAGVGQLLLLYLGRGSKGAAWLGKCCLNVTIWIHVVPSHDCNVSMQRLFQHNFEGGREDLKPPPSRISSVKVDYEFHGL